MTMSQDFTTTMKLGLKKLAPHEPVSQYQHNIGEDNFFI
jgi:hypothetical protein